MRLEDGREEREGAFRVVVGELAARADEGTAVF